MKSLIALYSLTILTSPLIAMKRDLLSPQSAMRDLYLQSGIQELTDRAIAQRLIESLTKKIEAATAPEERIRHCETLTLLKERLAQLESASVQASPQ